MISEHTKATVRKTVTNHFDNVPLSVPASTNPNIAVAATAEPPPSNNDTQQSLKRPLKSAPEKPTGVAPTLVQGPNGTMQMVSGHPMMQSHSLGTIINVQGQQMMAVPAGPNHPPGTLVFQSPQPPVPMVGMTGMMAQLHMNPTAIPPPVTINSPSGPIQSWSTPILEELKVETISEPIRKALRKLDTILSQAVKERNQFAEMTRVLVSDNGRQRDVARRYVAIIKQLQPMVPIHVQVGVKMDLEEIGKAASDTSIILQQPMPVVSQTTGSVITVPQQQMPSAPSSTHHPAKRVKTSSPPSEPKPRQNEETGMLAKSKSVESVRSVKINTVDGSRSTSTPMSRNPSITTTNGLARPDSTLPSPTTPTPGATAASARLPVFSMKVPRVLGHHCQIQNEDVVCAMALSRPFKYLFTASCGTVKIWDVSLPVPSPPMVASIECSAKHYIRGMKITPDGKTLLAAGEFHEIAVCDINTTTPKIVATIPTPGVDTYAIGVTNDSKIAVTCGSDHLVHVWEIVGGKSVRTLEGHTSPVTSCTLSNDMKKLFTGSIDNTVRVWDMETGDSVEVYTLPSHVYSIDINPFAPLFTAGFHRTASHLKHIPQTLYNSHDKLAISNGGWFLAANTLGKLQIYRSEDSQRCGEIVENEAILCAEISACGNFIVTGSSSAAATVYKVSYPV
ncbi:WD40-repeat-containing domain protein [Chytridium lagenaria]|nr:WD40-repeat-containing domain protein [Chytridium lagenaria]